MIETDNRNMSVEKFFKCFGVGLAPLEPPTAAPLK